MKKHFANVCCGHTPKPTSRARWFSTGNAEVGIWILSLVSARHRSSVQCCPFASVQEGDQRFWFAQCHPYKYGDYSYGGTSIPVLGKVPSRVWRGDFRCLLNCNLVESKRVWPIMVIKACLGMNIITYQDNDQLNRPQASKGGIYTHDVRATSPVSAYQLFRRFPRVFPDGVCALAGEYHMVLDKSARSVQHPPHRVPFAICERVREILEDLEKRESFARVTTPTPWISSIVVVPKKNGKLGICLDPTGLNRALLRENYPLPTTTEEVASWRPCLRVLLFLRSLWRIMGHSFRLTSFKYLLGDGLLIMSLHRLATLSQMVKSKTLCGQWSVCLRMQRSRSGRIWALLDWQITPPEGMDTSLAQRLMGRRCRTLLPMSESLLQPSYSLRGFICERWPKWKMAPYCSMEIYYDLLWFIWSSIVLKLIKYFPRKETFFMSYKLLFWNIITFYWVRFNVITKTCHWIFGQVKIWDDWLRSIY